MANTARLVIDPITRKISTKYEKIRLVQNDNNSIRITFEMPRYVRGHDMSNCSTAEVHYDNISIDRKQKNSDVYVVTDIIVAPEDDETINFSWLVSRGATQIVGNVDFSIHFGCNEDPDLEYAWHTTTYSGIVVLEGKHNTQSVVEKYPDLVASILDYVDNKISEFDFGDGVVEKITNASKVYATDANGNQTELQYGLGSVANSIVQRTGNGDVLIQKTPVSLDGAVSRKYVDEGLAGKLDALENGDRNTTWLYGNDYKGEYKLFKASMHGKSENIVMYGATSSTAKSKPEGTIGVNMPEHPYQAAPKKYVDDGLAQKINLPPTLSAWGILGTGDYNKDTGEYVARMYTRNQVGGSNAHVATFGKASDASLWTSAVQEASSFTLGGADPIYPIQYVNLRTMEREIAPISDDVDYLKRTAYGTLYDLYTAESTDNPVTVPSNALTAATIDKIGTGISQGIKNLIHGVSEGWGNGQIDVIGSNTIRLNGICSSTGIEASLSASLKEGQPYYFRVSIVSGNYVKSDGTSYLYVSDVGVRGFTGEVISSTCYGETSKVSFVIGADEATLTCEDLVLRLELGTQLDTECTPVVSVQKNGETIYTVPEAIRTLTDRANEGIDPQPVYGLALSDTVYNYLDLEAKQFVINCAEGIDDNFSRAIMECHKTIDVSGYLADDDGEIAVSAGDEILFVSSDGTSAGNTVPSTITYCIRKGG